MDAFKLQGTVDIDGKKCLVELEKIGNKADQTKSKFGSFMNGAGKLGSVIGNAGKASLQMLTGAVAGASVAVAGLTKLSIDQFAQFEQLIGGVETLFKESSSIVLDYADNAYKTAGMSANEYMNTITGFSASLLQGLGGDTKKAAEIGNMAVTDMSDNANKMGNSMESIQNAYQGFAKQNYTMLDNLRLGYGGTKEEMQRLLKDAEKLTGVKYDINNFDDVIEAIHAIQDEMGITGTTAKEASSTIEGSLNMTKAAWTNLLTGMADENANFDVLVDNLVDSLGALGENLLPRIEIALEGIGKLIGRLLPVIIGKIPGIINSVLPNIVTSGINIISALGNAIIESLPTLIGLGVELIKTLVTGIQTNLPQIVQGAMNIMTTLVNALIEVLPLLLTMGIQLIIELARGLAQSLPTLIPAIISAVLLMVETLINNIDLLIDAAIQLMIGLAEGLIVALPMLIDKIPIIIEKLLQAIATNLPKLTEAGIKLIGQLAIGLIKAIPNLIAAIPKIISSMLNYFDSYLDNFKTVGKNIVEGIWNGITGMGDWLMGKLSGFCSKALDQVKDFFGIKSPSRVFRDQVGRYMAQGIGVGFEKEEKKVDLQIQKSLRNTVNLQIDSINPKNNPKSNPNNSGPQPVSTIINFNGPINDPIENSRRIDNLMKDLAYSL